MSHDFFKWQICCNLSICVKIEYKLELLSTFPTLLTTSKSDFPLTDLMTTLFFNCDMYCRQFVSVSFTSQAFLSRVTPNNFPENLITSLGRATFFFISSGHFLPFLLPFSGGHCLWQRNVYHRFPFVRSISPASLMGRIVESSIGFIVDTEKNKDKITQSCLVALMLQSCCKQVAVTSRCINVASHSIRLYFQLRIPSSDFLPKNRPS